MAGYMMSGWFDTFQTNQLIQAVQTNDFSGSMGSTLTSTVSFGPRRIAVLIDPRAPKLTFAFRAGLPAGPIPFGPQTAPVSCSGPVYFSSCHYA